MYGEFKSCTILECIGDVVFFDTDKDFFDNIDSILKNRRDPSKWEGNLKENDQLKTGTWVTPIYVIYGPDKPSDLDFNDGNTSHLAFAVPYQDFLACTGDITKTGEVDVTDLSTMQEYLVDNIELEKIQETAADMNDDNKVDTIDLSEIQEYIVNH